MCDWEAGCVRSTQEVQYVKPARCRFVGRWLVYDINHNTFSAREHDVRGITAPSLWRVRLLDLISRLESKTMTRDHDHAFLADDWPRLASLDSDGL
jgi:hypothetical protein